MADDYLTAMLGNLARDLAELRMEKTVQVTNPAAGAEWSLPVPGGVVWELINVSAQFIASAAVANRGLRLLFNDGSVAFARTSVAVVVTANAAWNAYWSRFVGAGWSNGTAGVQAATLPLVTLQNGWKLQSQAGNIDVGDQWSNIFVTVREWDEVAIVESAVEIAERFDAYLGGR